jgi:WhiB family redox-sensing transcriptional regulator
MTMLHIDPRPPNITAGVETLVALGPSEPVTDDDWQLDASCATVENAGDLFFSEELGEIAAAKRICAECPVIAPCLETAIRRAEPWGVWGGQLFYNGRILANKRRRGRPPKHPRPEDQLPEIPIPEHLRRLIA